MNTPSYQSDLEAELKAVLGESGDPGDLLEVADRLRADYALPQPSAAGFARGHERLLAAIAQEAGHVSATAPSGSDWRSRIRRWFASSNPFPRLAFAGTLAVVVLFMCNTVLTISAESLPGDPLYSVKRAQEQVRFNLTLDEAQREQLQGQFDDTRVKEVEALQRQMREERIELSGHVESINGRTVVIDGLALEIPAAIDMGQLHVGDRVVVVVETRRDGKVNVVELNVNESAPHPTHEPSDTPRPSATARPSNTPRATETDAPTRVPRPSETPRPTEIERPGSTPESTRAPRATETERPESTPEPTRAPRATETERHDATETPRPPTVAPQPTETREPAKSPEPTNAPEPTKAPESTKQPDPTKEPESTKSPEPTRSR